MPNLILLICILFLSAQVLIVLMVSFRFYMVSQVNARSSTYAYFHSSFLVTSLILQSSSFMNITNRYGAIVEPYGTP